MTKLFYADPLAAIIMARNFLVEVGLTVTDYEAVFGTKRHDLIGEDGLIILYPHKLVELLSSGYMGCSLYVLSSSYSVFEPQAGDVVLMIGGVPVLLVEEHLDDPFGICFSAIIQRNGKPFFWPESE